MKRRGFVKALVAAPAAPSLLAQQPQPSATQRPAPELPTLEASIADSASDPVPHYFTRAQFAALQRLSDLLMPSLNGAPGALDAKAAEFLDFLSAESPADRQSVYRAGLDALNTQAHARFNKSFAELGDPEAAALLTPLRERWTYEAPADPLARFLRVAKQDVRTATVNSREYSITASRQGSRRLGASGLYWYPLD